MPAGVMARASPVGGDRPRFVPRPRLLRQLTHAARGPLTVISAPAGYGKTVLVQQWVAQLGPHLVAHVAIHASDDAERLSTRMAQAIAGLDVARGGRPSSGVAGLLDGVVVRPGAILVVDGLDAPRDAALVGDLAAMVKHAPPELHVIVTRRSRWAGARRWSRPKGGVEFIEAADLALTPTEAEELLRTVSGVDLSAEQVEGLVEKAEGWAAALQLAAVELQGRSDPDAVLERFGEERHLTALLHEEVLRRVPSRVRAFLLRTSVLSTLDASLCEAVTGDPAASVMLRLLEHEGLFTTRVDQDGGGYRYHALLRAALRADLRRLDPHMELALLRLAASWHARRDEPERAAAYLIEAEEWDLLIRLADRHGRRLFDQGSAAEVARWLEAVPIGRHPRRLALRLACLFTMAGQARRAEQQIHHLSEQTPGEQLVVDALRTMWITSDAHPGSVIRTAGSVLSGLDRMEPSGIPNVLGMTTPNSLRMMTGRARAFALWSSGDLAGARAALTELTRHDVQYTPWSIHIRGSLALLEAWSGNLNAAASHSRHALAVAADGDLLRHPWTVEARLASAHVARERGHLRDAERLLVQVGQLLAGSRQPVLLTIYVAERARLELAAGSPDKGREVIRRHRISGDAPSHPGLDRLLAATEIRVLLAAGQLKAARAVIDDVAAPLPPGVLGGAVQLALAQRDVEVARALLERWPAAGIPSANLERELWAAVLDVETGSRRRGLARAGRVIAEGSEEGHVQVFLDAGPAVERILRTLARVTPSPHVRRLADLLGLADQLPRRLVGLSERELEVVRYLPSRMSSAEIATRLYVSLNTLKTHLRAIYRKLGVTGREDAVRRAKELGLA